MSALTLAVLAVSADHLEDILEHLGHPDHGGLYSHSLSAETACSWEVAVVWREEKGGSFRWFSLVSGGDMFLENYQNLKLLVDS